MINIMDHIEAKHIAGISIPCGLCEQVFRTRVALRHHKPNRVILILKILFLQLLHGFKLFHLVSDFQNSFCF